MLSWLEFLGYRIVKAALGQSTGDHLARFSSSNWESFARKPAAEFRLYPARSFMSRWIKGDRPIRSLNLFDNQSAIGMMASPTNILDTKKAVPNSL